VSAESKIEAHGRPPAQAGDGLLRVSHLNTRYGTYLAINDVSFSVAAGEFFTLLGPSGCGKTSTLRCIAGLETPSSGEIAIGKDAVYSSERGILVPANRREIAMVFQSYAIWPHMTVFKNVAFPLQARGIGGAELKSRVHAALETVGLAAMADRPAPMLSGGQQQRVALARAIITNSQLLLLDEPLSNLDATLRIQMRSELRDLQRRIGATMIYVTHDQEEAMSLSDRIAVMLNGSIVEVDTPQNLYHRPHKAFTARFIGQSELIPCDVPVGAREGKVVVSTPIGPVTSASFPKTVAPGRHYLLMRPEHIQLRTPGHTPDDGTNVFSGTIETSMFSGRLIDYGVRINGTSVNAQTLSNAQWKRGDAVSIHIPPTHCVVVEGD
jgi:iron(III) transport system ATP-binding protein